MIKSVSRNKIRTKRRLRLRKKVLGNAESPRLSIFKSLKFIYIQAIDDTVGNTIVSLTTAAKSFQSENSGLKSFANKDAAKALGTQFAAVLKEKKITRARFDRSGYKYHGTVKELADAIREGGIEV
ncbi:MAG: 50S ribosomal protein L18 [Candidatus Auribacterota bacterium]